MATARLTASAYYLSNSSYLAITNADNMYANTDSTNYATIQNKQTGTTSYYAYIRGFNFDAIPDNATVNSFTIKFKAKESGVSTSTSYRPYLCNNTTTITGSCDVVNTSEQVLTFTGVTADWETIKGYGANFGIRINCRRNSRNTTGYMYIYGAEILVDYTVPIPCDITTSKSGDCTISPEGTTVVYAGDSFTLTVNADKKPTIIDNGSDVSSFVVEAFPTLDYKVETAPNASYGFSLNANGYYESTNKGKAGTASVCVVTVDLPVECTVNFKVINYAESTYDYGLLGYVDATLTNNASADTSNVYWDGKNNNSASVQTVTYTVPAGEHSIYVKYFKDNYTDSNNDTLQFKVEIEPNQTIEQKPYYLYIIDDVQGNHEITVSVLVSDDGNALMIKTNGSWKSVSTVYKKVGGSWIEVTDLRSIDTAANYVYEH